MNSTIFCNPEDKLVLLNLPAVNSTHGESPPTLRRAIAEDA